MTHSRKTDFSTVRGQVELVRKGALTSEEIVKDCLSAIDATDSKIGAWKHLDSEYALSQAKSLDEIRRTGQPTGDLHGIPVGVKDIFDTADMPTERGSVVYAGRNPESDSAVVEKLREEGAVVLGKTATTEFAYMDPAGTKNPHNVKYSPGGSSSGSAAAVSAGHVPLAIGSQTGGSTIRPASFCGIYGYKPTRGIISRRGVLQTSASLDQVGVFGRDPGDLALLCDVLGGYDASDNLSYLAPRPRMLKGYLSEVPVEPDFVWIDLPYADRYSQDTAEGFEELMDVLGAKVDRIPAPQSFSTLLACHKVIYDYELYRCLENERKNQWDQLSETIKSAFESARERTDEQYREALEIQEAANTWFRQFFNDYDAIITPAATGEAVKIGEGTGDPICCTIWTLCGLPCISLPLLTGSNGLPIGVQLVAAANEDDRLFRTTRWLLEHLRVTGENQENSE
jgi:Asp-tRNA(Asn)/Glu-tRNA(Gln) amidotransferase A subunit family amidase